MLFTYSMVKSTFSSKLVAFSYVGVRVIVGLISLPVYVLSPLNSALNIFVSFTAFLSIVNLTVLLPIKFLFVSKGVIVTLGAFASVSFAVLMLFA